MPCPMWLETLRSSLCRSTKVSAQTIDAAASLRLVVRAGAGTNTIDKEAAANHNIPVCNVPGKNAAAVAELAIGLLIAIDRRIPENVIDLKAGHWNKKKYSVAQGLYGRHMGIIGLGGDWARRCRTCPGFRNPCLRGG